MGDLSDTMCESATGVPVCLTLCPVCVCVCKTVRVNHVVFTPCIYINIPMGKCCDICLALIQFRCPFVRFSACMYTSVHIPVTSVCLLYSKHGRSFSPATVRHSISCLFFYKGSLWALPSGALLPQENHLAPKQQRSQK